MDTKTKKFYVTLNIEFDEIFYNPKMLDLEYISSEIKRVLESDYGINVDIMSCQEIMPLNSYAARINEFFK